MTFKAIEKKIKADGWVLVRIAGSHYQFKKSGNASSLVIPNHGSKDLSIGLIRSLERISGLSLRS